MSDLPRLSPDLEALLEVERAAPGPAASVQRAIAARLFESVAAATAATAATASAASAATGGASSSATAATAATSGAALIKPLLLAATFAAGVGTGVGGTLLIKDRPPTSSKPLPVATLDASTREISLGDAGLPDASFETPDAAPSEPQVTSKPIIETRTTPDRALASERALLEVARTALTRNDWQNALHSLNDHLEQFPHGRLAEERDALWIQALLRKGDREAAEIRARQFRERYPQSLFLPAIDALVGGQP